MLEQLAHPPLAVVAPRLQHHPDAGAPALAAAGRVDAEHPHLPGRPHPEALEDLDGGGLARPVRPEQRQRPRRAAAVKSTPAARPWRRTASAGRARRLLHQT